MAAGSAGQPGRVYFGSEPGGLHVSNDDGESFEIVESLWNDPSRLDKDLPWFGGGLDKPAIHSILVDPRDENCLRIFYLTRKLTSGTIHTSWLNAPRVRMSCGSRITAGYSRPWTAAQTG